MQSARSNGNHFFEVLGAIFLPENQTHSGDTQSDSLETTLTGVVELSFKEKLEDNGLNFENTFCEKGEGPPTTSEVIDEMYTRHNTNITEQEAEEMLQSYDDLFGNHTKFAKFRLRQTTIKQGKGDSDAFTSEIRQAGLPEGAQYEGKVKNSVYAVCHVQPKQRIEKFMMENELHKVTVDGEPELTAVVEAYVKLHAKIAMIMHDVDVKRMICDQNENVEMIRHTQALGKWVEDKVSALQLEHVSKRRKQEENNMSDEGPNEEHVDRDQVPLNQVQKNMITTVAEQYIRDARGEQGLDITRTQQHFAPTDTSKITIPADNDLHNALDMLNESQEGKLGYRGLPKSDRIQEMMREVLTEMMTLDVPNWEAAMKNLGYDPNLLHIEVPYVIRALVGNEIRTLYESQELTVPLFVRSEHKITETKTITLHEAGEVVDGWKEWEWPHCVAELLEQVEHDSPKILEQTHSELVRIMPGEYGMIESYFQAMRTATDQEQEALTDRLIALYDCRPTNKPRTWAEAIRLKYGDVTTFQPNEPQVHKAVEYPCKPRNEYEHDGEEEPADDVLTKDKLILLGVYARWKMYGKMALLMCVPTCKTSQKEPMETTVETWIRTGCMPSDLSMTLESRTNLRTVWAGQMQAQNQSDTANDLRMLELRNQECWEVCQRFCLNQAAKTGGMVKMRLEYKMFHNRNDTNLTVRGLLAFFAAIAKTIHKDLVLSKKTGAEATSMGKWYKQTVLARAHHWAKLKHPFDIRAYSTTVEETPYGILVQLTEQLPAKWFIAAFGGQGLKIEQYEYKSLNYTMKDVVGITKPNTGVKTFGASGWEFCGTANRVCFEWMRNGCSKGDKCTYEHEKQKYKSMRNIHEPARVKNTINKQHQSTNVTKVILVREPGPQGSTRRRDHGGRQPMRERAKTIEEKGGNKGTERRELGREESKQQKGGGGRGRQEWYHRQVAHEQLGDGRCGKIDGGNWLRRKRNTGNSQLQTMACGTKGGYHMRASGWRTLGTESQGTGACTILWVVGKGAALESSQGTKIVGQKDGGWIVSNAPKKKETAKTTTAHMEKKKKKKAQTAHQAHNLDPQCKYTVSIKKTKVQATHKTENSARHEQTPDPKHKIHSTLYENGKWHGKKKTESGKRGQKKKENPGEPKKQNQKRRNEGHTNQAQWEKQRGENQEKKRQQRRQKSKQKQETKTKTGTRRGNAEKRKYQHWKQTHLNRSKPNMPKGNQLALSLQAIRWVLGILIMTMTKNHKQTMTILLLTSTHQWMDSWIYKTNMNTTMQEINRWQRWVLRHNGVEFPQQEMDSQEERKRKQQQKQTLQWRVEK